MGNKDWRADEQLARDLLEARDADDVVRAFEARGQEISKGEAHIICQEAQRRAAGRELSHDELDAIAGGDDRVWSRDGCAATVEAGSWCGSNDMCLTWSVTYDTIPSVCPKCGKQAMVLTGNDYTCNACGYVKPRDYPPEPQCQMTQV